MPTPRRTSALLVTAALAAGSVTSTAGPAGASAATPKAAPATAERAKKAQKPRKIAKRVTTNKATGKRLALKRGWKSAQFRCLTRLWQRESGWNHLARNGGSGAYGIPQALPGRKMASAGKDWRHNPRTQIKWGLSYIKERYATPCGAWAHFRARGWY
ncbi:transglycosylase SLT domain-containing protein [Spongiactinospora sp. TRM90649]|uniref:aggregation-promoting factor C-terminal-like domain-containing protein n=1 Tax=Spongiactinospora sp. TRM90649 TaxID=3031114 RepID=UPI003211AF5E